MECDNVIHVGDDKTDENVFALARRRNFLTIRVGATRSSLARGFDQLSGSDSHRFRGVEDLPLIR
jgi:trehalose-6-phosphatase